jgi:hypothetical protein
VLTPFFGYKFIEDDVALGDEVPEVRDVRRIELVASHDFRDARFGVRAVEPGDIPARFKGDIGRIDDTIPDPLRFGMRLLATALSSRRGGLHCRP